MLEPLRDLPDGWEILVVDDHSGDATAAIAAACGARVLRSRGRRSDSAARNTGAEAARGAILVFLDADVVTDRTTLEVIVERVRSGACACAFAVYDAGRDLPGIVTRFKNYWIRHSTLDAPRPLDWINTSLAAIRQDDFMLVGGFCETFTARRGGGDLDFGRRVLARVGPVVADATIQVRHLKRFTLGRLIRNDFARARGWFRLARRRRGILDVARRPALANVGPRFSAAVAAAGLSVLALPFAAVEARWFLVAGALAAVHAALSFPFLASAAAERIPGWRWFWPLLWIDHLACAAGLAVELGSAIAASFRLRPTADPEAPPAVERVTPAPAPEGEP